MHLGHVLFESRNDIRVFLKCVLKLADKSLETKAIGVRCTGMWRLKTLQSLHFCWKHSLGMGKNPEIPVAVRKRLVQLVQAGTPMAQVAKQLSVSRSSVWRAVQRFRKEGSMNTLPRSGRPRMTTEREDRILRRLSVANPMKTAPDLKREMVVSEGTRCSVRTIRRRLCMFGLYGRHAVKKPLLSLKNRRARLRFADDHAGWTGAQWKNVIFSDESKFQIFGSDGKIVIIMLFFIFGFVSGQKSAC